MRTISTDELRARLDDERAPVLIDARSPASFERAHLPGAVSGKSDDIVEQAESLAPDREATVIAYTGDSTCRRALRAAERLEGLGYTDVLVYEGGLEEWRGEGLPVEQGAPVQG